MYRIDDQKAIISTVDFFPPVVDDPYAFGAIAAANAMSDVYAMGGEVLFAVNLAAFPGNLEISILSEILRGGADCVREAGAVIAGGHTITDKEPKYGLAVTGLVDPKRLVTKGGAKPGDVLILTKPLGAGVVTTALKRGLADQADVDAAIASMMALNRSASQAALAAGAHAMTDVTGYGLLGHAHEMAHLGGVDFVLTFISLPWLPGAQRYAAEGAFPGGAANNAEYYRPWIEFDSSLSETDQMLLFDPETSGGLLIAVDPARASVLLADLAGRGVTGWRVGHVTPGDGHLRVERG